MKSEGFKFYSDIYSKVMTGFLLPIALKYNIAEQLVLGAKSISELTINTNLNQERLQRYLLQLESNGIFSYDESTKLWSNNANSEYLLDLDTKSALEWRFSDFYLEKMKFLEEMLFSDLTAGQIQKRPAFFEELKLNPENLEKFQKGMKGMTSINQQEIIEKIVLNSTSKVIDIGGGDGSLIVSLCKANSDLTAAVYERPEVADLAKENFIKESLQERTEVKVGNFLIDIPSGYNTLIMKHILHDWPDDICEKILHNCRAALAPGGKLYIIDSVLTKNSEFYKHQRYYDITMMMILNAKERTTEEFQILLEKTGFKLINIHGAVYENIIEAEGI